MTVSSLAEPLTPGSLSLRNEPVQARSTARLAGLLDAAAAVIDELGYERLTTAMVAERAGASIGTVYRYFPDRIAVLQALAARNLERTLDRTIVEINKPEYTNWEDALDAALAVYVDAFRTEPGFRSLRVGDVIDLRPVPNDHTFNSIVADAVHGAAAARFGIPADDSARFLFECAVELADSMASRAFLYSADGDPAFLEAGRGAVHSLFDGQFSKD